MALGEPRYVSRIDPGTFAIHEPHYWQQNVMYVLKGEQRAILFDTGYESERNNRPTTSQALHLINSGHIQRKLNKSPAAS